jgi:hypothetical protein
MVNYYRLFVLSVFLLLSATSHADSYDPATKYLTIPSIVVSGTTYTNLVIRLDSIAIISVDSPPSTPTSNQCSPANVSGNGATNAVFQDASSMMAAFNGTWTGCDVNGKPVSFAYDSTNGTQGPMNGTINSQTNYYATYTNCTYRGHGWYMSPVTGEYDFNINAINCAEGSGLNTVNGDVLNVYSYGGHGTIDYLVLELDFKKFAIVRKSK